MTGTDTGTDPDPSADAQQAGDEAGPRHQEVQLQAGDGHPLPGAWQVIALHYTPGYEAEVEK